MPFDPITPQKWDIHHEILAKEKIQETVILAKLATRTKVHLIQIQRVKPKE
jgi:hypothetical protein